MDQRSWRGAAGDRGYRQQPGRGTGVLPATRPGATLLRRNRGEVQPDSAKHLPEQQSRGPIPEHGQRVRRIDRYQFRHPRPGTPGLDLSGPQFRPRHRLVRLARYLLDVLFRLECQAVAGPAEPPLLRNSGLGDTSGILRLQRRRVLARRSRCAGRILAREDSDLHARQLHRLATRPTPVLQPGQTGWLREPECLFQGTGSRRRHYLCRRPRRADHRQLPGRPSWRHAPRFCAGRRSCRHVLHRNELEQRRYPQLRDHLSRG